MAHTELYVLLDRNERPILANAMNTVVYIQNYNLPQHATRFKGLTICNIQNDTGMCCFLDNGHTLILRHTGATHKFKVDCIVRRVPNTNEIEFVAGDSQQLTHASKAFIKAKLPKEPTPPHTYRLELQCIAWLLVVCMQWVVCFLALSIGNKIDGVTWRQIQAMAIFTGTELYQHWSIASGRLALLMVGITLAGAVTQAFHMHFLYVDTLIWILFMQAMPETYLGVVTLLLLDLGVNIIMSATQLAHDGATVLISSMEEILFPVFYIVFGVGLTLGMRISPMLTGIGSVTLMTGFIAFKWFY